MTAATASQNEWAIRPISGTNGTRWYQPVAKLADGSEVACGVSSFASVREARVYIITKYDGGRAFPKPVKPFAYTENYFAEMGAIARTHRGLN